MANPGVYPVDTATDVGKVRILTGDMISVPLSPVVAGQQNYTLFSDDEIELFLAMGGDSPIRAAGWAYMQLSGAAAQQAESIKDYDLQVDSRQKAEALREQAAFFFFRANELDLEGDEAFQIVPTGTTSDTLYIELTDGFYYNLYGSSPYGVPVGYGN